MANTAQNLIANGMSRAQAFERLVASGVGPDQASLSVARLPITEPKALQKHRWLFRCLVVYVALGFVALFWDAGQGRHPQSALIEMTIFVVLLTFAFVVPVYFMKWWGYVLTAGYLLIGGFWPLVIASTSEGKGLFATSIGLMLGLAALYAKRNLFPHQSLLTGPRRGEDGLYVFDVSEGNLVHDVSPREIAGSPENAEEKGERFLPAGKALDSRQ